MKQMLIDWDKCRQLCTCGQSHPRPEIMICQDGDPFSMIVTDCRTESSVLIIDDENTHQAGGGDIVQALASEGVSHQVITLPGDTELDQDIIDTLTEKCHGHSLILAVGAGTINDLGKSLMARTHIPYRVVPTAASMNGYTSSIAAVKVAGVKRTLPAPPPQCVYLIDRIIQHAPLKLQQSGFCDVLAKSVSDVDWQAESILFSHSYCRLPSALVAELEPTYTRHPEQIRAGSQPEIMALLQGLLISGAAMTLAGSSAPASGGEHLVSHVLDMRQKLNGRKPELHGLQVGAGILFSAACYQHLARLDVTDLKPVGQARFESDAAAIAADWGPLAPEVTKQFLKKRDQLIRFDTLIPTHWDSLRAIFRTVKPPEYYLDLIRRAGYEMTLESLRLDPGEFLITTRTARTIRDRITVLDIAAHAGVLEQAARDTLALIG